MAEEHDKTHRLVFAFPRMVEDLIRFCLGDEWVERLDFSTLEKVPERLLSPELVRREQDVLWRLKYVDPEEDEDAEDEDRGSFVYFHLEHLSRPKSLAALDTAAYKMLVLQDLSRRKGLTWSKKKKRTKELPWIFSAVLYTGEKEWKPTTSLLELVKSVPEAPEDLGLWGFRLIDFQRFPLEEGAPRMRITDLVEVPSMLAQRIDKITRGWELRGWATVGPRRLRRRPRRRRGDRITPEPRPSVRGHGARRMQDDWPSWPGTVFIVPLTGEPDAVADFLFGLAA